MARKPKTIKIRCDSDLRSQWKRVCAELDADADYDEILETLLDAFEEEPDLFERIHRFGRTFDQV